MRAITQKEYETIITTIKEGFSGSRPNYPIALALTLEANIGLRMSDILDLNTDSFIKTSDGYIVRITEKKTKKVQQYKFPKLLYNLLPDPVGGRYFSIGIKNIQKKLRQVSDYLGYQDISTHSFRKFFATRIYNKTKDIELVSRLLNHSSAAITKRYIGIDEEEKSNAIEENLSIFI